MSTQTFDETQHPRGDGGRFAPKPAGEATGVALSAGDPGAETSALEACDTCGGSLAEDKSPNVKTSCVFCTGEVDYDFPALDDETLSSEQKIAALADAASAGEVDVRWAHHHAINLDDTLEVTTAESMFDDGLSGAGTDWDALLTRDLVTPEEDATWANESSIHTGLTDKETA